MRSVQRGSICLGSPGALGSWQVSEPQGEKREGGFARRWAWLWRWTPAMSGGVDETTPRSRLRLAAVGVQARSGKRSRRPVGRPWASNLPASATGNGRSPGGTPPTRSTRTAAHRGTRSPPLGPPPVHRRRPRRPQFPHPRNSRPLSACSQRR